MNTKTVDITQFQATILHRSLVVMEFTMSRRTLCVLVLMGLLSGFARLALDKLSAVPKPAPRVFAPPPAPPAMPPAEDSPVYLRLVIPVITDESRRQLEAFDREWDKNPGSIVKPKALIVATARHVVIANQSDQPICIAPAEGALILEYYSPDTAEWVYLMDNWAASRGIQWYHGVTSYQQPNSFRQSCKHFHPREVRLGFPRADDHPPGNPTQFWLRARLQYVDESLTERNVYSAPLYIDQSATQSE